MLCPGCSEVSILVPCSPSYGGSLCPTTFKLNISFPLPIVHSLYFQSYPSLFNVVQPSSTSLFPYVIPSCISTTSNLVYQQPCIQYNLCFSPVHSNLTSAWGLLIVCLSVALLPFFPCLALSMLLTSAIMLHSFGLISHGISISLLLMSAHKLRSSLDLLFTLLVM